MSPMVGAQRSGFGNLSKLGEGVRVNADTKAQASLSSGPNQSRKLNNAAWTQTFPAPGATLDLDFVNNRGYIRGIGQAKPLDLITFTRASSATFIDSDGLLKGPTQESANLIAFPQNFENTIWGKNNASAIVNAEIAPDNSFTAQKLVENTINSNHWLNYVIGTTRGLVYTWSIYLKAAERTFVGIFDNFAGGMTLVFNLISGAQISGSTTGVSVIDAGNGWWRISRTLTSTGGNTYHFDSYLNATTAIYQGDGASGIYMWGFQLEIGSSATQYVPTNINQPRFNWASNAVLVNKNQIINSQVFASGWAVDGLTVADARGIAPDGTPTAYTFAVGTGNNRLYQFDNSGIIGIKTFSFYAKSGAGSIFSIGSTVGSSSVVDLNAVTATNGHTITSVGNGWYRISISGNISSASGNGNYWSFTTSGGTIFLWGVQNEVGPVATTYQETGAAAITINAPIATIPTSNGILNEQARTNRLLWCRDASSGTGTNMLLGSASSIYWIKNNASIGLTGNELVLNGDFSQGSTSWTLGTGATVSNNELRFTSTPVPQGASQSGIALRRGYYYYISINATITTGTDIRIRFGNSVNAFDTTIVNGLTQSIIFIPQNVSNDNWVVSIFVANGVAANAVFDNLSVREIIADNVLAPDSTLTAATATANNVNATLTQSVAVATAAFYTFSVWLRRKTGTGNIDITSHSGGTWVTQAITTSWVRYSVTQSVVATTITPGIRIATNGDQVEVWGPQLTPGIILMDYQPTTTTTLFGWSKINATVAKDQTGIDGIANTCTSITATAANALLIQPLLLAVGQRVVSVYLKRLTGIGNIQVTLDGSTYSTVDLSTTEWRRISLFASLTNPMLGIRIALSGDAVTMDFGQIEDGIYATTPIVTRNANVTRSADIGSISIENSKGISNGLSGTVAMKLQPLFLPTISNIFSYGNASNNVTLYFTTALRLGMTQRANGLGYSDSNGLADAFSSSGCVVAASFGKNLTRASSLRVSDIRPNSQIPALAGNSGFDTIIAINSITNRVVFFPKEIQLNGINALIESIN